MPYRRRYPVRRRRRPVYRRRRAVPVRSIVKRELMKAKETKWNLNSVTGATVFTGGLRYQMIYPSIGDGPQQRDGREVKAKSVRIRLGMAANATTEENWLRVMVVQSRKNEPDHTFGSGDLPSLFQVVTPEMLKLYNVLYDRTFSLNSKETGNLGFRFATISLLKGFIKSNWASGTTTAIAPDEGGAIQLCFVSNDVTNGPSVTFESQCNYVDV